MAYFSFGKTLFAAADLLAGWLIERVLTMRRGGSATTGMPAPRARAFAAIWLLNPMVATISTRGSSEGLLAVLVMALLWATLARRVSLAAVLLGVGVHFKIYPFIYAPAIVWWMDDARMREPEAAVAGKTDVGVKETKSPSQPQTTTTAPASIVDALVGFLTVDRLKLALLSMSTFLALNLAMYALYGHPFVLHTFLHHVSRIDHRHNFSPYNILLYLSSSNFSTETNHSGGFGIESVAFLPQLLLSCVLIPIVMAKKDLPATMLAQTWAFVAFNKVCTSQVRSKSSREKRKKGEKKSSRRAVFLLLFLYVGFSITDILTVFSLVSGPSPLVPTAFFLPPTAENWYCGSAAMDPHPSRVATARLST